MRAILLSFVILAIATASPAPPIATKDLIDKIVNKAIENDKSGSEYGFSQKSVVKEFDSDGKLKKQETRLYRTTWIEGKPYSELLKVNDRPLDESRKKDEAKRRHEFVEELHGKKTDKGDAEDLKWDDLFKKYEFTQLPSDDPSPYVLQFQPKKGNLSERNRVERIFNNLSGRIWADEQYNLTRAETKLLHDINFGLGIVAHIDQLDIAYSQKPFEDGILPASFTMKLKARIALFKSINQEVNTTFSDYFRHPKS